MWYKKYIKLREIINNISVNFMSLFVKNHQIWWYNVEGTAITVGGYTLVTRSKVCNLCLHRYPNVFGNMKTEVIDMTSYEIGMMVLGVLTFIVTLISLIVKLLLVIIDKDNQAKK